LLGAVRSGESKTISANALTTGTLLRFEAWGTFSSDDDQWANVVWRFKLGSSLKWEYTTDEPDNYTPSGYLWRLTVLVMVATAGDSGSSSTLVTGVLEFEYPNDSDSQTPVRIRRLTHVPGTVSGALDTTTSNVVDLTWDNASGGEMDMTCRQAILTRY
jgi:hypothetical protein